MRGLDTYAAALWDGGLIVVGDFAPMPRWVLADQIAGRLMAPALAVYDRVQGKANGSRYGHRRAMHFPRRLRSKVIFFDRKRDGAGIGRHERKDYRGL